MNFFGILVLRKDVRVKESSLRDGEGGWGVFGFFSLVFYFFVELY